LAEEIGRLDNLFYYLENAVISFNLETVYDIGASDGSFTNGIKKHLHPDTKYHLFEPYQYPEIEVDSDHQWHRVYLSDKEKKVQFYINDKYHTGNSYYRENTPAFNNIEPTEVTTVALDSYVAENNLPLPDIIKIDTQGSELDILKGGTYCLKNASIVILEVPLLPYNEGSPEISEILNFMLKHRFVPFTIVQEHKVIDESINIAMAQIDIAFVKIQGYSSFTDIK
jgi:FkbM family methyltransferase